MELTNEEYASLKSAGLESQDTIESPFGGACFNDCMAADIMGFATDTPDPADMTPWGISEEEWREGQKEALQYAMYWYEDDMDALDELVRQNEEFGA